MTSFTNSLQQLGLTPLHEASSNGHGAIVSLLLAQGANQNEKDFNGKTPREVAANEEIVKIFDNLNEISQHSSTESDEVKPVSEDSFEESDDPQKEIRDYFEAAMYGDIEKIKAYILIRRINVNTRDMADWTAVMAASQRGHADIVKYLLDNRADVSLTNNSRANALHYADNGDIAGMLVAAGAPIDAQNEFGETPLHTACNSHFLSPGILNVVKILISKGANCNIKNNEGQTPLHIAVRQENVELIKILLSGGADPAIKDANELTPMDLATSDDIRYLM